MTFSLGLFVSSEGYPYFSENTDTGSYEELVAGWAKEMDP